MDNYKHIKERFSKNKLEPLSYNFHAPLELRKYIYAQFNNSNIEICAEPGFNCSGCISEKDLEIFGIKDKINNIEKNRKGFQRNNCTCLSIKRELFTDKKQCPNLCLYCYWK